MSDKIIKFPRRSHDRIRRDQSQGVLRCVISERWLQFPKASYRHPDMEYLELDVMTLGADEKPRKICSITVDKERLLEMLNKLPYK